MRTELNRDGTLILVLSYEDQQELRDLLDADNADWARYRDPVTLRNEILNATIQAARRPT